MDGPVRLMDAVVVWGCYLLAGVVLIATAVVVLLRPAVPPPESRSQAARFVVIVPLRFFPARLVYEAEADAVRIEPEARPST